ncbi:LysM peptidoglycan-binding domain-containing protein [Paenibacillus rhizoplanae]
MHIVKQGDSLFALSQKYGVPLQKNNRGQSANRQSRCACGWR